MRSFKNNNSCESISECLSIHGYFTPCVTYLTIVIQIPTIMQKDSPLKCVRILLVMIEFLLGLPFSVKKKTFAVQCLYSVRFIFMQQCK